MKPDPSTMTLDEYIDAREAMGAERRKRTPISYGIHSADAFIKRYHKYEAEYEAHRGL